ncbi:MAG: TlpA family protein disulfide reductase [Treponema sp.]|nr:TlpA family protein disulfide reductase [Treponema sp.]
MRVAGILAGVFVLFAAGAKAEEGVDALFSATMTDVQGKSMQLSGFQGRPLIVKFWERICAPCRDEFPVLIALQKKYKKQGLTVLGIALEKEPDKVRDFLVAYQVNYPVALAGEQGIPLMQAFGNEGALLPFTLLIDRRGEVVLRKVGVFQNSDFQGMAGKLLQ